MKKTQLLFLMVLLLTTQAWALDEIIHRYRSVRSLGMGNTVFTTGRYEESLYGNPANLVESNEKKITILGLTTETNTNFIGDLSKVREAQNSSGTGVISTISNGGLIGRNEHVRATLMAPGFFHPKLFSDRMGLSAALLLNSQANVMLRGNAAVDSQTFVDVGPSVGWAYKLIEDQVDIGVNVHANYRVTADRSIRATEFLTGSKLSLSSIGGQGFGIDGDLGGYYKLPVKPSFLNKLGFAASVNNVLASTYTLALRNAIKTAGSTTTRNARTVNVGFDGEFPEFFIFRNTLLALEMQDIGHHEGIAVSTWKRFHLGTETKLSYDSLKWLAIRLGLNQGYLGGGLGFDFPVVKVDFAAYGEELGANTGQLEDIRLALRLSFEI